MAAGPRGPDDGTPTWTARTTAWLLVAALVATTAPVATAQDPADTTWAERTADSAVGHVVSEVSGDEHDPIRIEGDVDPGEAEQHGITSGSGTVADPYVIEGWEISARDPIYVYSPFGGRGAVGTGDSHEDAEAGLVIRDTDQHFLVHDLRLHGWREMPSEDPAPAVRFDDAPNVGFIRNVVEDSELGIDVLGAGPTIRDNVVNASHVGVRLDAGSSGATVRDNRLEGYVPDGGGRGEVGLSAHGQGHTLTGNTMVRWGTAFDGVGLDRGTTIQLDATDVGLAFDLRSSRLDAEPDQVAYGEVDAFRLLEVEDSRVRAAGMEATCEAPCVILWDDVDLELQIHRTLRCTGDDPGDRICVLVGDNTLDLHGLDWRPDHARLICEDPHVDVGVAVWTSGSVVTEDLTFVDCEEAVSQA